MSFLLRLNSTSLFFHSYDHYPPKPLDALNSVFVKTKPSVSTTHFLTFMVPLGSVSVSLRIESRLRFTTEFSVLSRRTLRRDPRGTVPPRSSLPTYGLSTGRLRRLRLGVSDPTLLTRGQYVHVSQGWRGLRGGKRWRDSVGRSVTHKRWIRDSKRSFGSGTSRRDQGLVRIRSTGHHK